MCWNKPKTLTIVVAALMVASVVTCAQAELVAHWKFDGDANDSVGTNHGVVHGAQTTDGVLGGALVFDGQDDYVLGSTSPFDFANTTFTASAWFKKLDTEQEVLVSEGGKHSGWSLSSVSSGRIMLKLKKSNGYDAYSAMTTDAYASGQWHHVAAVITTDTSASSGNNADIYVDGNLVDVTDNKTGPYAPSTIRWTIGTRNAGYDLFFNGMIDDVRIYNEGLSGDAIDEIYAATEPTTLSLRTPAAGEQLVAGLPYSVTWDTGGQVDSVRLEYKVPDWGDLGWIAIDTVENVGTYEWIVPWLQFRDCLLRISDADKPDINSVTQQSFTIVPAILTFRPPVARYEFDGNADNSVGPEHGTLMGGAEFVTDPDMGSVLILNGTGDYVEFSDMLVKTTEFTITAWANVLGPGGGTGHSNPIFSQRDKAGSSSSNVSTVILFAQLHNDDTIAGVIVRSSSGTIQVIEAPSTNTGQWHHYALTVDSDTIRFYMDGVLAGIADNLQVGDYITSIDYIDIGRHRYTKPGTGDINEGLFNGMIDEVRVYDQALSGAAIGDIYSGIEPVALSLRTPGGGEKLLSGIPYEVTWNTMGQVDAVRLEYNIPDWGPNWITIDTVENVGAYEWVVPPVQFRDCLLRISDADNPDVNSVTPDPFTIVPAALMLEQPVGGEELLAQTTYNVEWDTIGEVYFILLEYRSLDPVDPDWVPIDIVLNTGSYEWTIPALDSSRCFLRISDVDRPLINSENAEAFAIFTGEIFLHSPNGGEELLAEHTYDIRWETIGEINTVWLEYGVVDANDVDWQTIGIVENTGLYEWIVPNITSSKCLVRISNADSPRVHDLSNSFFTILGYDCVAVSPADMNGDCRVDLYDLAVFVRDWLFCGREPERFCWE